MIEISEKLVGLIKAEAEKAYPNECCGFIFGHLGEDKKTVCHIEPCRNSSDESEQFHRFVITPENMMKAELYARKKSLDIIGFYHSHPDCAAVPSEYDRSHALPVYSYIIVSAQKGKAVDFLSWELDAEKDFTVFGSEDIIFELKGE